MLCRADTLGVVVGNRQICDDDCICPDRGHRAGELKEEIRGTVEILCVLPKMVVLWQYGGQT